MIAFSWIAVFVGLGSGLFCLAVSSRVGKLWLAPLGLVCLAMAGLDLAIALGAFK